MDARTVGRCAVIGGKRANRAAFGFSLGGKAADIVVACAVGDKHTVRLHMREDSTFGDGVFLHIGVPIEVVGRDIGENADIRKFDGCKRQSVVFKAVDGVQLEAGKLYHSVVLRLHLLNVGKQWPADVAAQKDAVTGVFEHLCHKRCGGGLAVAAGYGENLCRAERQKRFHFAGDERAVVIGF